MSHTQDKLFAIASEFALDGPVEMIEAIGNGLINDTYRVTCNSRYLLQRLNTHVFYRPREVMENIARVSAHLATKPGHSLELIPTHKGENALINEHGEWWRVYHYIEQSTAHQSCPDRNTAYQAARSLGAFIRDLADLPAPPLNETLPAFHDTLTRFKQLRRAVETDGFGRLKMAQPTLEQLFQQAPLAQALSRVELPLRTVHNDTKLNNVLFHQETNEALCVVDLDTVMPGQAPHDFGDMVRSAASTHEGACCQLDLGRFEALLAGWLEGLDGILIDEEKALLTTAPQVITYELALRYMTDYLEGDHYFKTKHPEQNLERCQRLLTLLDSMQKQESEMQTIVKKHLT